jgi:hypothetical protein
MVSAMHFGVTVDQTLWKPLSDYATGRTSSAPPQFDAWLQSAVTTANTLHFFHWELEFPEVFFNRYGHPKGSNAGFNVVIGNPPYVRQEELGVFKPYFAAKYPETYDGVADLYIYFYQQGLHLTREGGRMSYIVTNKWMRSGYGQSLRTFFAQTGALERIVDFGHAPIFEDADVFPCILILDKPQRQIGENIPERQVQVLNFPREELSRMVQEKQSLSGYIREQSHSLPHSRLSSAAWNIEVSAVDDLLAKIRLMGIPLTEFSGVKPTYGIKTGLNEAFLIDTSTKNRLVRADPRCAEIIKPCLRGQDIKRWSPEWAELWMIMLKSSSDYSWSWGNATDITKAEVLFQQAFPSLYNHMKPLEERLRNRQDKGRYWWELRPCAYYHLFEQPKIITQDLATYSWFGFDNQGFYSVNTCYIWPTTDLYMLGWLCSPIAWWICHRMLQHSINDTLRMFGEQAKNLPIAPPTDEIRTETEQAVARLIAMTRASHEARQLLLDWLRIEFEVQEPGKLLENFTELDLQAFVDEVRKRRPRTAKKLTPAALKALRDGYGEQIMPLQQDKTEVVALEYRISDLINSTYNLTAEEIALLWATAPPRMPLPSP